jgi:hypothetical protein
MHAQEFLMSNRLFDYLDYYTDINSETFGNAYKSAKKAGYSDSYARVITVRYRRGSLRKFKANAEKMRGFMEALKRNPAEIKQGGNPELLNHKTDRQRKKLVKSVIARIDSLLAF